MAIPKFQDFLYPFLLQLKDKDSNKATSNIVVVHGIAQANYLIVFNVGVSTRKTYEVKRIDTDYFEE